MSVSLRLLRAVSFLLFAFSALFLLVVTLADIAPRQVKVRDADHKVIGTASIPPDESGIELFGLVFFTLSGLQLWTISAIFRSARDKSPEPLPVKKS